MKHPHQTHDERVAGLRDLFGRLADDLGIVRGVETLNRWCEEKARHWREYQAEITDVGGEG